MNNISRTSSLLIPPPGRETMRNMEEEGMQRVTRPICCGGVLDDVKRRSRFCLADYVDGVRHWKKSLAASLFMFFATFFSTVALGALIQKTTNHRIGLVEYLLMNACAGMAHSLLGAQPLLVLRPTGPITSIIGKLSDLADLFGLDFWRYMAATGVCVGALMGIVAAFELSRHIKRVTPFTHDVFACFVCSIYLHDGVTDVLKRFQDASFGQALLDSNLALCTFVISLFLFGAPSWRVLHPPLRNFLSEYAVTIAVVFASLATALVSHAANIDVQRIPLASGDIRPTCWWDGVGGGDTPSCANSSAVSDALASMQSATQSATPPLNASTATTDPTPRPWLSWLHMPPTVSSLAPDELLRLWALALASAIPITFFFYMDQNISSLLCQLPKMGLARGKYFHATFLAMGLFNAIGPLLGLPFVTASLPHSPQFVSALTSTGKGNDAKVHVAENRLAPFLTYALLGTPLLFPQLLRPVPEAAIDGVLAYVGVEGILGTMLWKRTLMLIAPADELPAHLRRACGGTRQIHMYTFVQLLAFLLVWVVNISPLGLCVSFVIVSLVPFRERVMPRLFSSEALRSLESPTALEEHTPSIEPILAFE